MDAYAAVDLLERVQPRFHGKDGALATWQSQRGVLDFIAANIFPGMASLETGCGYSTVVFTASGSRHTSITPHVEETERVAAFCAEHGIPREGLNFGRGRSEFILPGLSENGPLDAVYIDGSHRFPYPCIDWVYTEQRLKVGGLLLVDDVRIPTCRMLHDFLKAESNWSLNEYIGDTAIFRKTAEADFSSDWQSQGFNASYPDYSFLPRRSLWRRILARLGR